MDQFSSSRLCNFLLLLVSGIILLSPCYCDHLRQSTDVKSETEPSSAATSGSSQQTADPAYIKRELKDLIIMKIDTDRDGSVSYEELKNYLSDLHEQNMASNVDKQWVIYSPQIHEVFSWEGYEPEKREVLTWDHYFNQTYPELIGVNIGIPIYREQDTSRILNAPEDSTNKVSTESSKTPESEETPEEAQMRQLKLMVSRADARWKLADENGDTLLTKDEFKFLLHPDEGNEELQNLFVREATEDMDLNKDGTICLEEFMKHLKILASPEEWNDKNWLSGQQENFGRFLDKNKDAVLDNSELRNWLVPTKSQKFQAEAKRLLDIGDANEDHKLSPVEILDNFQHFLGLLPPEYWKGDSDDPLNLSQRGSNHEEL